MAGERGIAPTIAGRRPSGSSGALGGKMRAVGDPAGFLCGFMSQHRR
jgi:hypothetical protein